jgi:uncharacterized protein (DUF433 family)
MRQSLHLGAQMDAIADLLDRITTDSRICGGRPTIRGTRIRVSDVLEMLAAGMETENILSDFPELEVSDIRAAALYAARAVSHPVIRAA